MIGRGLFFTLAHGLGASAHGCYVVPLFLENDERSQQYLVPIVDICSFTLPEKLTIFAQLQLLLRRFGNVLGNEMHVPIVLRLLQRNEGLSALVPDCHFANANCNILAWDKTHQGIMLEVSISYYMQVLNMYIGLRGVLGYL